MATATLRKAPSTAKKETTGNDSAKSKAMATAKRANVSKSRASESSATPAKIVSISKMKDYSNTPGLKKKADAALAFLQKHGLVKKAKKAK